MFAAYSHVDVKEALQRIGPVFKTGLIISHSLHNFLILNLVLGASLFVVHRGDRRTSKIFLAVTAYILVTLFWYGFLTWGGIAEVKEAVTKVFPMHLDRFHVLYPTLWILLFAIILGTVLQQSRQLRPLVLGLLGLQILYQLPHHELIANHNKPSLGAFFAEDQFRAIRDHIGKPPRNTVSPHSDCIR